MTRLMQRGISLLLSFVILISMLPTAFALPLPDGDTPSKLESYVQYLSNESDETGFNAKFMLKNLTDQNMTDWIFTCDYNVLIETPEDVNMTYSENEKPNAQYRYHYEFRGIGTTSIIPANSTLSFAFRANTPLNINDIPQNMHLEYTLQPENPFLPSDTAAYARQMWIADLMEAANFSFETMEITSTFVDVSIDNPYLNAIEMAVNNNVITTEEIGSIDQDGIEVSGPIFHPQEATTREFAILTSLKALGYINIDTPSDQYKIAVNIGLLDPSKNGTIFTTTEARQMLLIVAEAAKIPEYDEGFETFIDIKDTVLQPTAEDFGGEDYKFMDGIVAMGDIKAKLIVPNTEYTRSLEAGTVIFLPVNNIYPTGVVQKVDGIESISDDEITLNTSCPQLTEFLGEGGLSITGSEQSSYVNFTPSENFVAENAETANNFYSNKGAAPINQYGHFLVQADKVVIKFDMVDSLAGKVTVNYPKVDLDVKFSSDIFSGKLIEVDKCNIIVNSKVDANITLSGTLKPSAPILLGRVDIPLNGGFSLAIPIYLVISATGEVSVQYGINGRNGVLYSKENGLQTVSQNSSNLTVVPSKFTAKVGVKPLVTLTFGSVWDLANLGLEGGAAGEASETVRMDGGVCLDTAAYMYLNIVALTKECILGELVDANLSLSVFNKDKSPLKANFHYEVTPSHTGQVPSCTYGNGSFSMQVRDYESGLGVASVLQAVKVNGAGSGSITLESQNGNFQATKVSAGTYEYTVTADGYLIYTGRMDIQANNVANIGTIRLVKQGTGSATGTITDALTGRGISGVNLTLFRGSDISGSSENTAEQVPFTGEKDSDFSGNYSLSAESGYYTLKMQRDGYLTKYINVTLVSSGSISNATLVPNGGDVSGTDIGDLRIVLTWGATPNDLDSHLCGPSANGIRRFHIFYSGKNYSENGKLHAFLDRDDTNSFGPETTTVYDINTTGKYSFYVHDYTNKSSTQSSALSASGARVDVYVKEDSGEVDSNGNSIYNSKQIATYSVPANTGGTLWHVFDYNAATGLITPRELMTYTASPSDVGQNTLAIPETDVQQNEDIAIIRDSIVEKE